MINLKCVAFRCYSCQFRTVSVIASELKVCFVSRICLLKFVQTFRYMGYFVLVSQSLFPLGAKVLLLSLSFGECSLAIFYKL